MLILLATSLVFAAEPSPLQLAYMHPLSDLTHCDQVVISDSYGDVKQRFDLPAIDGCPFPLWSPDGKYLAVWYPTMMLINVQTGSIQALTHKGWLVDKAIWSQNGSRLAWIEYKDDIKLWTVLNLANNTTQHYASLSEMEIAPDELHYWDRQENQIWLFRSGQEPEALRFSDPQLTCSIPASLRWEDIRMLCMDDLDLLRVDGNSQTIVPLTNTPDVQEMNPRWSPDGRRIAYQAFGLKNRKMWLEIMTDQGTDVQQLTAPSDDDSHDEFPQWSPDGQYIVFERHSGVKGLTFKIYVIKADGTGLQYMGDGIVPSWRPIRQS